MNNSILIQNLMVVKGDIIENCTVVNSNRYYYFLEKPDGNSFYDIVLPKQDCYKIKYNRGDKISVVVDAIHIADDNHPGAFVKPKPCQI